jgi:hypothetical protein
MIPCHPFRRSAVAFLSRASALVVLLAVGPLGCAQAQERPPVTPDEALDLPPAGFGTLRQDDVSLRLRTTTVLIQVVPLDERVIRLLSPDTYSSLHRLVESKADELNEAASRLGISTPSLFLVTFFGLEREARFNPDDLTVTSQNRLFRPAQTFPLSPLWSAQQLGQRETATAIYLFEDGIRTLDPFAIEYVGRRNDNWEQVLRTLERERASVIARAAAARP